MLVNMLATHRMARLFAGRRIFRRLSFAGAVVAAAGCGRVTAPDFPSHVLLISIDALRADHLGVYGYARDTSPFLSELAGRGILFRRAFVNTHGTTPSHASMLSSLYQETHRVGFSDAGGVAGLPEQIGLLQEELRRHGYRTIGVTDGGNIGASFGFGRGFDVFHDRGGGVRRGSRRLAALVKENLAGGQPLFLFFHTYEVHSPYQPPAPYAEMFGPFDSDFSASSSSLLAHAHSAGTSLRPADLERLRGLYDGEIRLTDDTLRHFFEELDALGVLKRALVVVTGDHGEEFGEHGGLLHRGLLYDELLHVPLIVAGPGIPGGQVEDGLVSEVDIAPSLLGHLGFAPPPAMEGRSFLAGGKARGQRAIVAQYGAAKYAVRTDRWKLILTGSPEGVELYDLAADPRELRRVEAENPEVVATLRGALAAWKSARRPVSGVPPAVELSQEEIEQLKSLGYLGGN